LYWPPKQECITRACVERGKYRCEVCEGIFKAKELQADHIDSVIDPEFGFIDWNTYIANLFCDTENFQALCKTCHIAKTMQEDAMRQYYRDINKEIVKRKKAVEKEKLKKERAEERARVKAEKAALKKVKK